MGASPGSVVAEYWDEVWNHKNLDALDRLVAEAFTLHIAGADLAGPGLREGLTAQWFDPFPDISVRTVLTMAADDLVAEHLVFTGTHTGAPFLPGLFRARGLPAIPASGRPFEFTQTCVSRVDNGLLAEMWEDWDRVRMFLQLGVGLEVPSA
jgi:predicted ester cyclase